MKYKTIVADPPWRFRNRKTGGSRTSGSEDKYKTMSLEEVKALPVYDLASPDTVLFLWTPTSIKDDALDVLHSWGFRYKTTIYWIKTGVRLGMGFWFRNSVEECLVAVKPKAKAFRCQKSNTIYEKPRRHSQKPDIFWELIEPITQGPKLELFARERRPGWHALGDELKDPEVEIYNGEFIKGGKAT